MLARRLIGNHTAASCLRATTRSFITCTATRSHSHISALRHSSPSISAHLILTAHSTRLASSYAVMSQQLGQRGKASAATAPSTSSRSTDATPAIAAADQSGGSDSSTADECYSDIDARFWWSIAGVSGALAVALGAFGAHGLKNRVSHPRFVEIWSTGAQYHLAHTFALCLAPLAVAAARRHRARTGQQPLAAYLSNIGLSKRAVALRSTASAAASNLRLAPYRNWSARCFVVGTVIFSGSLYALAFTEQTKLGAVAPIGGFALMAGWILLAIGL